VFHTTEAQLSKGEVQEIRQAMEALQEAEKLDPKQPAYRRARELLEPQMYFAKRDAHQDESPYTGQYADVIPLGAKEPYGETMKRYGWVPGTAWTRPAPKARQGDAGTSSGSYDPEDSTTYILLGIGALFVIGAIGQGGSGGRTGGSGQSPCFTCGGQGRVSYWNGVTNRIEWYRCRACWGRIP
jgi:hypothetical protein